MPRPQAGRSNSTRAGDGSIAWKVQAACTCGRANTRAGGELSAEIDGASRHTLAAASANPAATEAFLPSERAYGGGYARGSPRRTAWEAESG